MDDKLASFLSTLTDEQKELFKEALSTPPEEPVEVTPTKTKPKKVVKTVSGKSTKRKPVKKTAPATSRKRIIEDDEEPVKRAGQSAKKKKPCRVLPLETGERANRFLEFPEFDTDKHLVEEDRANWKGKKPTPRSGSKMVIVKCDRCHQKYQVSGSLVYESYVCDDCITSPGRE